MKKRFRKITAVVLAAAMVMSLIAASVYAAENDFTGSFDGSDSSGGGSIPGGSSSSEPDSYTAVNEYTETITVSDTAVKSTGTDENAVLVATEGITVTLENVVITRVSSDSTGGDTSSFYGVGACVLVTAGTVVVKDSFIYGDGAGAAGVFAYDAGVAYVINTIITTEQDTSGGIHVAGGGTIYAWDLTVTTEGGSSAAIRSDRGGGTMVVDGGTYTSNGTGSPAIYSAGTITVNNATLVANSSEAVCMEGFNVIRLYDCNLTGSMPADNSQNDCVWNIILYQSTSGDAEEGNAYFEAVGGSITSKSGGMFYTTNTESTYVLKNVELTYSGDDEDYVIKVTGNSNERGWGTSGENGAYCTFSAYEQELEGKVIWDSISTLDLYLLEGSTLTGYVVDDETAAGEGGNGYCSVYIDAASSFVVTGDSTITNLYSAVDIKDASGNLVTIKGTDGTIYVSGTSEYTITVSSYSSAVDVTGADPYYSFADYEVSQNPEDNTTDNDGDDDSGDDGDNGQTEENNNTDEDMENDVTYTLTVVPSSIEIAVGETAQIQAVLSAESASDDAGSGNTDDETDNTDDLDADMSVDPDDDSSTDESNPADGDENFNYLEIPEYGMGPGSSGSMEGVTGSDETALALADETIADGIYFTSADETVAAVDSTGLVTGEGEGSTVITVAAYVDGVLAAETVEIPVTVTAASADSGNNEENNSGNTGDTGSDETTYESLLASAQSLITGSAAYTESDYTAESWKAYQSALEALKELVSLAESGEEIEVDALTDAVNAVIAAAAALEDASAATTATTAAGDETTSEETTSEETTSASSSEDSEESPTTGDSGFKLWLALGIFAACGLAYAGLKRKFS